uniref:Uncharacterized protein n=1 Tax=Molossus molossus TaxID=27622 RepID=A0A7J8BKK4_MOLMO|nr:hypothetical protein HJG59_010210 [Molossus molossus]
MLRKDRGLAPRAPATCLPSALHASPASPWLLPQEPSLQVTEGEPVAWPLCLAQVATCTVLSCQRPVIHSSRGAQPSFGPGAEPGAEQGGRKVGCASSPALGPGLPDLPAGSSLPRCSLRLRNVDLKLLGRPVLHEEGGQERAGGQGLETPAAQACSGASSSQAPLPLLGYSFRDP